MVHDPVARLLANIDTLVDGLADNGLVGRQPSGDVRKGRSEQCGSVTPPEVVIPGVEERWPEAKGQLGDDLTRRGRPVVTLRALVSGVADELHLLGLEDRLEPVLCANVGGKGVVDRVAQSHLQRRKSLKESLGEGDIP